MIGAFRRQRELDSFDPAGAGKVARYALPDFRRFSIEGDIGEGLFSKLIDRGIIEKA